MQTKHNQGHSHPHLLTKSVLDDGRHEEGGGDQGGGHEDEQQGATRDHHVGSLSLVSVGSEGGNISVICHHNEGLDPG